LTAHKSPIQSTHLAAKQSEAGTDRRSINQGTIMTLWKLNKITGYWVAVRSVSQDTKEQWLKIYTEDEPNEVFKVSKNKPKA
jgi:hypothetical protein